MESHELLREVFQKISPKNVAAEMGLSLSMVYKWAEPPDQQSGAVNPIDRVVTLNKLSQDTRIVQWLCQKSDGFFIKNPAHHHEHPEHLVPAMNTVVQEFADLLAVIAASSADSQVTPTEAKAIRARWEELNAFTEEFVSCCEAGNFRGVQHAAGLVQRNK